MEEGEGSFLIENDHIVLQFHVQPGQHPSVDDPGCINLVPGRSCHIQANRLGQVIRAETCIVLDPVQCQLGKDASHLLQRFIILFQHGYFCFCRLL